MPRDACSRRTPTRIVAEAELDRDALVARSPRPATCACPLVEDPGIVRRARRAARRLAAVARRARARRALRRPRPLDQAVRPDRSDDAEGRAPSSKELWLPPAREAILDARARRRARAIGCAQLADDDRLADDARRARSSTTSRAGARSSAPRASCRRTTRSSSRSLAYLAGRRRRRARRSRRRSTRGAARRARARAASDAAQKAASAPHFPLDASTRRRTTSSRDLEARASSRCTARRVAASADDAGSPRFEVAPRTPLDLAAHEHDDLDARREGGARVAAARRGDARRRSCAAIAHWQRARAARRSSPRARRRRPSASSRSSATRASRARRASAPFDPAWLDEPRRATAQVVVGPLARGVVAAGRGPRARHRGGDLRRARAPPHASGRDEPPTTRARSSRICASLAVGDYVVHVEHGIGRYQGSSTRTSAGLTVDLLVVEYAGGDKLYLPVYRLNQIQKYSGGEGGAPKLDRLGGADLRARPRRASQKRRAQDGRRAPAPLRRAPGAAAATRSRRADDDYRAFEATFPFDETPDQARAIDDVQQRPRDAAPDGPPGLRRRRLRQDRGRAARGVPRRDGRQAGRACSARRRCSRSSTSARSRRACATTRSRVAALLALPDARRSRTRRCRGLKDGKVDIVIGTHRLLSKDVHFKDLGLLVVDEEQRFGVAHKERIKQLRAQVDVLTLTATPIPRTLQMAVAGLRDLSLITTPPVDRRAVRTFVTRFDEHVIARGGPARARARRAGLLRLQPRRGHLRAGAARSQELVPEARIAVGHGQMSEARARARRCSTSSTGSYDVLVRDGDHRERPRHPARQHDDRRPRRPLRPRAALPAARPRRPRARSARTATSSCRPPNAMTDEARVAHRGARAPHRARHRLPDRVARPRAARRGRPARRASSRGTVAQRRLRSVLPDARRGGARAARRAGRARRRPRAHRSTSRRSCPRTTSPTSACGSRSTSASRAPIDEAHVAEIAAEMEDRFGPPPDGGAAPRRS